MSSLIRKGGAPKFKPKAPQSRRSLGATPTPSAPSSTRQSLDRQSETPGPPARTSTPPPTSVTELLEHQEVPPVDDAPAARDVTLAQETVVADITDIAGENCSAEVSEVQGHVQSTDSCQQAHTLTSDETSQTKDHTTLTPEVVKRAISVVAKPPVATLSVVQYVDPEARVPQDVPAASDTDLSMLALEQADQPAQVVLTARLLPDGTSEILKVPRAQKQAKRPAKRRKVAEDGVEIRPTIEVQINQSRSIRRKKKPKDDQDPTQKKRREATPEDAEEQEIDHATLKMSELTKDLRIGRKFSRHAELKQRETDMKNKAKLSTNYLDLDLGLPHQVEGSSQTATRNPPPVEPSTRPQMRIVDGQIVIDDASLVVDRHAIAATATDELEEVEEDDFTRITTSGTYMKREKKISWAVDDVEKFYMGLRMFGTDFEMISQMFPNRTRKQIKLKFVKDQREVPRKLANALSEEPIGIDLEEYKLHTGLEYQEVADIEAEQAHRVEEHNAHERSIQAESEETSRQKRAEIQSRAPRTPSGTSEAATATVTHPGGGTESAKENEPDQSGGVAVGGKASAASKSKKKSAAKRKKRNPHSTRGGGEEFEVLGTIDAMQGVQT